MITHMTKEEVRRFFEMKRYAKQEGGASTFHEGQFAKLDEAKRARRTAAMELAAKQYAAMSYDDPRKPLMEEMGLRDGWLTKVEDEPIDTRWWLDDGLTEDETLQGERYAA